MSKLQLVRATPDNGLWDKLEKSWLAQLKEHRAPIDWAQQLLEHARKIADEIQQDHRYGIYVACGETKSGVPGSPYEGFVHVNFKLPKTSAAEIRLVWNRLAPRYQLEDLREEVGVVQNAFISGALKISEGMPRKPPIKMFLGNPIDQEFGRNFSRIINSMPDMPIKTVARGNWLHISWA